MSIDRTDDVSQAVENILEARDALFDGLIVSGFDDPSYVSAVKRAHDENPVMVLGSLEAYRMINLKTLAHVGDEEMDVGRLAGNVMQEAGMKVNAAAASLQRCSSNTLFLRPQTVLCLSYHDNMDSMHRCRGFQDAFGNHTYDLNLKTTVGTALLCASGAVLLIPVVLQMQSELKSKLIPIILDDKEINGLFMADARAFGLVHQILKSLNRLCSHGKTDPLAHCIYFGAHGIDRKILQVRKSLLRDCSHLRRQAMKKKEVQFTIHPQEHLKGYLATTLMTLESLGYTIPPKALQSASLTSRTRQRLPLPNQQYA